jgi:geranylgeranyl diphosphate synthase, type II
MLNLKSYAELIEVELTNIQLPNSPIALYDPITYFLKIGGKRIRPILTLLAAELFSIEKSEVIPQALAIEIFHNFTLIHDDIMDLAPLRRNQQTVHEKWDSNVAILTGDALMIIAYQHLGRIELQFLPEAFESFNKTALEVCEGQQMDMDFETRNDVTIHEYIEMIRLKTSVLLGAALNLGAIVAKASTKEKESLRIFGENIGIAFQIQDDILDLYSDPTKFGKQVGGDVIANKKTILQLTAKTKANPQQLEIITQLQTEQDIDFKINRTKEIFDHLNVKQECIELMQKHYTIALNALESINVSQKNKEPLIELAKFLITRDL